MTKNKFIYTRPNGTRVSIEPFNINYLFALRYSEKRKWYSHYPTEHFENRTICEEFKIPKSRLDEIRMSIEYRECAIVFLRSLGISPRNESFGYSLHKILGVKESKKDGSSSYAHDIEDLVRDFMDRKNKDKKRFAYGDTHNYIIDKKGIINSFVGENDIKKEKGKWSKIDQYKHERRSGFKGISKKDLIIRVEEMIDSRDYWKSKCEDVEPKIDHLRNEIEKLVLKISNLESENAYLRRKIEIDGFKNAHGDSRSNELESILDSLPKEIRKVVRNKFMIASHPDKIGDAMDNLSTNDKQLVNRFFDFFQKLLRG